MKVTNKAKDSSTVPLVMAASCVCVSASLAFESGSQIGSVCGSLILIGGAVVILALLRHRRTKR